MVETGRHVEPVMDRAGLGGRTAMIAIIAMIAMIAMIEDDGCGGRAGLRSWKLAL